MSDDKPKWREWWIIKSFTNKGTEPVTTVHEEKVLWKSMNLGDEKIHVIEAAPAFDEMSLLEQDLETTRRNAKIFREGAEEFLKTKDAKIKELEFLFGSANLLIDDLELEIQRLRTNQKNVDEQSECP